MKLIVGGKGFRGMLSAGEGESDRLTLGWSCTPSTLASTYLLLHGRRLKGGGSVRSQFDGACSLYWDVDASRRRVGGGATRSRFYTFWPPRLLSDGTIDRNDLTGLPADPGAAEEFWGGAQREALQVLEARRHEFEPPAETTAPARRRPNQPPPAPRRPRGITPAEWQQWLHRRDGGEGPAAFTVEIEQLRHYFLVLKKSQFTVVSLSGHEYMHVWLLPHEHLANDRAVGEGGAQLPWSSLYTHRPSPPSSGPGSAGASTVPTDPAPTGAGTPAPPGDLPRGPGATTTDGAAPASPAPTTAGLTSSLEQDAEQEEEAGSDEHEDDDAPPPPDGLSARGLERIAELRGRRRRAAIRRNERRVERVRSHAEQIEIPEEDVSLDHFVGQGLETEELWRASIAAPDRWGGPRIGPPVAGFIAAYDPLSGRPLRVTDKGDFFTFEAQGSRIPLHVPAIANQTGAIHAVILSGGPFHWEHLERIAVLSGGSPNNLFGQEMYLSRDAAATPPSEEDQRVQAFTHLEVDELRKLHRHPIPLEPIFLFAKGYDRKHAFTRSVLPAAQSLTPEQRSRIEAARGRYDHLSAELMRASGRIDAAVEAAIAALPPTTSPRTPTQAEREVAANPSRSLVTARREFDATYTELRQAYAEMRAAPPLANPELSSVAVATAWYADRAVPFPTFFETRDDTQYHPKSDVRAQRDPIANTLKRIHDTPSLRDALTPALADKVQSAVRLLF